MRFALRGIHMYVPEAEITLIGAKPDWVKGVHHVLANDSPEAQFRERNIFRKLLLSPHEEFLYANDDHFLLAPWQGKNYHEKRLENKLYTLVRGSIYRQTVNNTLRFFPKAFNFDVHCPITMNLSGLKLLEKYRWETPYGHCLKTLYAAVHRIEGEPCVDLKIRQVPKDLHAEVASREWFSTADGIFNADVIKAMRELYPHKSRWES